MLTSPDSGSDSKFVYNYWQTSFDTTDPDVAEQMAKKKGLEVEWKNDPMWGKRYMVTKFYISAYEYNPFLDRNTIYSSIADDYNWFDSWPGLADLKPEDRPLSLRFGSDL